MDRVIGYMLTWTTYGTWLQGERKGWVKDGKVMVGNAKLRQANASVQKNEAFRLNKRQKRIVRRGIEEEAEVIGQRILAITVCSNHVHVVVEDIDETIGKVVGRYKKAGSQALKCDGSSGKVWTNGYDKRFCHSAKEMQNRITYVERHGED